MKKEENGSGSQLKGKRLTIPGWMYLTGAAILVFASGMMTYDYYLGNRLTTVYHPLTDALVEIKIEWTKGYIKVGEVARDSGEHTAEIIDEHFAFVDWYANAILNGGRNSLGTFKPADNAYLRRQVEELKIKLGQFRTLSLEIVEAKKKNAVTSLQQVKLHIAFNDFVEHVDIIETVVQNDMRKAFDTFQKVQLALLIFSFAFIFTILGIFRFYELRRVRDYQVIRQANLRFQEEIAERKRIEEDLNKSHAEMELSNEELRTARYEVEKQNWLQSGETELHDVMNGEQDIHSLSNNIITYLAKYLNSFVGAFYVSVSENSLRLSGSYAYYDTDDQPKEIVFGEGLIGQAAKDKKLIVLSEIPDNYISIKSSLGQTKPYSLVLLPLLFEDEVRGVLELGAFHEFNDFHLGFLEQVADDIGVAINLCQSRDRMKKLLEQTCIQAAELQAQQEELRVTNEELQEQTEVLKESEERLQVQQEELRVANEELEERTRILEKQKEAIRNQNIELERAKADIQQKARDLEMASKYKSEFLANMSHELRTPLNSMIILSHLLSDKEKNTNFSEKQIDYAKTIHSSGKDLLTLINEILDLSKVEAGKLKVNVSTLNFTELMANCEGLFGEVAEEKNLEFHLELADGLPESIETDGQRLVQIINNFLSNAFKFTEEGSVTLNISRPGKDTDLSSLGLNVDKSIVLSVIDTGIGIPENEKQAIFNAFQQADGTTSRKYGGTGLGLSISRELAKLLGGEIRMSSVEGEGTAFALIIPDHIEEAEIIKAQDDTTPVSIDVPKTSQEISRKSFVPKKDKPKDKSKETKDDRRKINPGDKTLLVIEDDSKFSKVVVDLAKEKGFQCLVAEDGETGLHFADYYKPSAIILDIGLPGIDGWQVMERLKANPDTRHIPVHFISAHDNSLEAMKMGAIGYLSKPVEMNNLQEAFHNIEAAVSKSMKKLLIVEDDDVLRKSLVELIGNGDVETTDVGSGEEALQLLQEDTFDCMILDLGLKDMSGFDLLTKLRESSLNEIPIIIYTGKALSRDEESKLQQYTDSIIVKGIKSPERLLSETTLFLHRVEADLPEEKQKMLRMVHDKEAMLAGKKIMLVDDDMRNLFALTNFLEEKGMEVVVARDGRESLTKLEENGDVDLILMDIMMPEMDGYETMGEIRKVESLRKVPIIALTAKAMKGDKLKCIQAGANDYLAKPIDSDKLLSLLRVWLYQ